MILLYGYVLVATIGYINAETGEDKVNFGDEQDYRKRNVSIIRVNQNQAIKCWPRLVKEL